MTNSTSINLDNLNVEELRAITESAQQLIHQKQHQSLFEAYIKFEQIAKDTGSTIEDILKAGESLEKKRSIKYRNTANAEETWTGRGRKPTWLVEALAAESKLEDFAI
ncbi:H-NS family nucleoid-associated regulatory protein [Psychrobacter sp. GP33]|uniref:H-NS histone family protein n=1 Tax=Psychrobacter sp. GP33 TaxID=2758709 RepID=UPI0015FD7D33|nr:H-NS histone family protein [Psychrobacter sp. GP33]